MQGGIALITPSTNAIVDYSTEGRPHDRSRQGREFARDERFGASQAGAEAPAKLTIGEGDIRFALTMLAITFALVVPAAQADSSSAVESSSRLVAPKAATSAVPVSRACPSARKAVKFYARRINDHLTKMGAAPSGRSNRLGNCPRYLAHVLQRKAYAVRATYLKWKSTIGVVVNKLNRVLASTPLAGTGSDLEEIGRSYHVSPYFIVAVAATESSIGVAACSSNRKNIWGLSSCGSGWYVPQFPSWRAAYEFFAAFVNRQWPGHSSPYSFSGYAACSSCWAAKVSSWMHSLFGVSAVTRYP